MKSAFLLLAVPIAALSEGDPFMSWFQGVFPQILSTRACGR